MKKQEGREKNANWPGKGRWKRNEQ